MSLAVPLRHRGLRVAYVFAGSEIQKRSYPTSFGGQWQNKGYELIDELKLVENARRIAEEAVALPTNYRRYSLHSPNQ